MGFLTTLLERREHPSSHSGWERIFGGGMTSHAGVTVTEEGALSLSTVFACAKVLGESVAMLPLLTYRKRADGGKERAPEHPLYSLLHDLPNPEMTAFEWRETKTVHVALRGNGYSEIEWSNGGRPLALWPLNPAKMEIVRQAGELRYLYQLPDGTTANLPSWRVHHVRGMSGNGIQGYSVVRLAMQSIGLGLGTEEFGARWFGNGARPGLLLKAPGRLSDGAYARLKESWNADHQGLSNAHRVKILEEGLDAMTVGVPPEESQFLETRKFQVNEIARWFRVPPHMVGDLEHASFSNIEEQGLEFVIYTLMPWLVRHEQAISRDLLTETERQTYFVKYLVNGLLRGNIETRYAAYSTAILNGIMSPNEVRILEDMNPYEGGDTYLLPLNMVPADQAGQLDSKTVNQSDSETVGQSDGSGQRSAGRPERRAEDDDSPDGEDDTTKKWRRSKQKLGRDYVPLFEDVAGRVVRREVADMRRAVNKHLRKRSVDDFRAWLNGFYAEFGAVVGDAFRALVETYGAQVVTLVADELGKDDIGLTNDLRAFVQDYLAAMAEGYVASSRNQIEAVITDAIDEGSDVGDAIEERLDGWEETRPGKMALQQAFEVGNALAVAAYGLYAVTRLKWAASGKSCNYCLRLNGSTVAIESYFVNKGDSINGGPDDEPLKVRRNTRHGPIHGGCLAGDSLVLSSHPVAAASKRWFDGDVVVIETASGHKLTCTPNHPILTPGGWMAAGLLNKGDDVISDGGSEWRTVGDRNSQNVPARIEEVVEAFGRIAQVVAHPMPVAAEHFHGDGVGSEVAVIWADGLLMDDGQAALKQQGRQYTLVGGDGGPVFLASLGSEALLGEGFGTAGGGEVGGAGLGFALGGGHFAGADETGGAITARGDALLAQDATNGDAGDAVFTGQGIFGLPRKIFANQIVGIQREAFHGWVYNLQTATGWYVAESIITHNCDCVVVAG